MLSNIGIRVWAVIWNELSIETFEHVLLDYEFLSRRQMIGTLQGATVDAESSIGEGSIDSLISSFVSRAHIV